MTAAQEKKGEEKSRYVLMYDIFPKFIYYRKWMFPTSLKKVFNPFIFNATGIQSARKSQWCIISLFAKRLESSLLANAVVYNPFMVSSLLAKTVSVSVFICDRDFLHVHN